MLHLLLVIKLVTVDAVFVADLRPSPQKENDRTHMHQTEYRNMTETERKEREGGGAESLQIKKEGEVSSIYTSGHGQ